MAVSVTFRLVILFCLFCGKFCFFSWNSGLKIKL